MRSRGGVCEFRRKKKKNCIGLFEWGQSGDSAIYGTSDGTKTLLMRLP